MKDRTPLLWVFGLFIAVQLAALALAPFYPAGSGAFPDENNPVNPLIYVVMLLLMTGLILLLIRLGLQVIIKIIFMVAVALTSLFVFLPLVYQAVPDGNAATLISLLIGIALVGALLLKPEWYVVDLVGFVVGCGAAIVLGISFGILPVLILLVILAVYDAISVYKTRHMLALADGVVPLRLPVLFVVPKEKEFTMDSLQTGKPITEQPAEERGAMLMGVGDAVIPAILTVSVYLSLPSDSGSFQYANLLVALGTLLGSCIGFFVLMRYVLKGRPQAGLPLLNGGAILGFVIAYLLVFQDLSFGIVL
ncbi:MAG TPA: presenilin family intramembrane aspartyl protease PSH [Methanomassiliicoccales archaeon]|nr:presenilin family intramembrane aspartyl protease PSH [Methanomassiliicoccales archaeon]